jgi:hypothetical protein
MEQRTTRLTVLIDPRKKEVFEHLCAREDQTPSQVVRRLIRDYIEQRLGRPWQPGESLEELRGQWPSAPAPPAQTDSADEQP